MKFTVFDQTPASQVPSPDATIRASLALGRDWKAFGYASSHRRRPQPSICIWAFGTDSQAKARRQLGTRQYWRSSFKQGLLGLPGAPEYAAAHQYSGPGLKPAAIEFLRSRATIASGTEPASPIKELATRPEKRTLAPVQLRNLG